MVSQYANQLKGLTLQQAELALSTKMLTNEQKQQILAEAGLIATENTIQAELLQTTLAQSGLNEEKQKAILIQLGLMKEQTGEILTQNACTKAELENMLALHGVTGAQAENIISTLGLSGANTTATASFGLLTKAIWANIAALAKWLVTNPVGWAILAGTAIAGVVVGVNAYNKKIQEGINTANEAKSATQDQIDTLDDYKNKIEELRASLNNSNLSEDEAYEARKNLISIQDELSDKYGIEKDKIDLVNGSLKEQIDLLDKASRQKAEDYLRDNKDAINNAIKKVEKTTSFKLAFDYSEFEGIRDLQDLLIKNNYAGFGQYSFDTVFTGTAEEAIKYYQELYDYVLKYKEENAIVLKSNQDGLANIDTVLADISNKINNINNEDYKNSKELYDTAIQYLLVTNDNYTNLYLSSLQAQDDYYEAVASNNEEAIKKSLEDMKTAQANYQNALNSGVITDNGVAKWFEEFYNDFIIESNKYQFKVDVDINVDNIDSALKIAFAKINKENPTALDIKNLEFSTNPEDIQAFESLTYIAAQYGMTIEELIPILEDLGYVQKTETQEITDETKSLEDLAKTIETVSKKVKLITSAMEEQADTGYISSSTYAEIIEMGGNFADCLEVQNGKLKLNVDKLKDLEKQELRNELAEIRLSKASWETVKATKAMGGEDTSAVDAKLRELTKQEAVINQAISEITNAKPKESGSGGGSSTDPWKEQFDKAYSEKQHLLAMEKLSEVDYLDWLDNAYKEYFSDLTKYQDEYYKYEEEVYKGRKKLAEDYHNDRISELEKQLEITTRDSTDKDGNLLNTQEKYDYIRSIYQDIFSEIDRYRNEITQAGVEGHEEALKELEKQLEEYKEKLSDVFKDAVEEEKDYIEKQKDTYSDLYDEHIDKIKEQQKASEEAAQAEIDAIDAKIDALKKANDKQQEAINLEKARQKLENAKKQRTRAVLGADGTMSYQVDQDKIDEAQNELDEALNEQQISLLEDQKELLETSKDKQSEAYDTIIENLESQKEEGERQFDVLLKVLDEYLNPDNTTSNTDVWSKLAKMQGAKYENGTWYDKDGSLINIEELKKASETKTEDEKKAETDNSKSETDSALKKFLTNMEKQFNLDAGSLTLEKVQQAFGNSISANYNPYGAMNEKTGLTANGYTSYVNNENANITSTFNGDIIINNPVGNSNDLAQELIKNLPSAINRQTHKS